MPSGRSVVRRSRSPSVRRASPSRGHEQSLTRRATPTSVSSLVSSQSSSQLPQGDRAAPEDVLRGLIEASELSDAAIRGVLHGVKRPHDDESADEPSAKRDKLGEELERMSASYQSAVPTSASSAGSSTFLTSVTAAHPRPLANGASNTGLPRPSVGGGTSGALPIRPQGRRPPRLGNGTTMSRSGIPEVSEPPSPSDDN